jgi:hypothetical protein
MKKFSMRLSHKLPGDRFLCRMDTGVDQTFDHVVGVFVSFLALLMLADVFAELLFVEE